MINYIIRNIATSFAIKRGRFTQDSGYDWFVGSVHRWKADWREREKEPEEINKDIAHSYLNL